MVTLSRKVDYALLLLTDLGRKSEEYTSLREIAKARNLPLKFLGQVANSLKRGNIVLSREGKGGGYKLSKPPDKVSVLDVVRVIDGELTVFNCLINEKCFSIRCANRLVWQMARKALEDTFSRYLLSDLISGKKE